MPKKVEALKGLDVILPTRAKSQITFASRGSVLSRLTKDSLYAAITLGFKQYTKGLNSASSIDEASMQHR